MTKARDIADFKFENITDTGTEGTKIALGTTAQRGSTQGQIRFNSTVGLAEYYDGTSFKSIDAPPTISSLDVTEVDSQAGGNQTIVITGSGFSTSPTVILLGNAGTNITPSSVTRNSDTQITIVAPKNSFLNAQEPYGVKVTNVSGLSATLASQINVDTTPAWTTASGTLATILANATGNHATVAASDADGDTISYSETASVLSGAGLTLNSSSGAISGDPTDVANQTTLNFTLRATANSKNSDRAFSIIINPIPDGTSRAAAIEVSKTQNALTRLFAGESTSNNHSNYSSPVVRWFKTTNSADETYLFPTLVANQSSNTWLMIQKNFVPHAYKAADTDSNTTGGNVNANNSAHELSYGLIASNGSAQITTANVLSNALNATPTLGTFHARVGAKSFGDNTFTSVMMYSRDANVNILTNGGNYSFDPIAKLHLGQNPADGNYENNTWYNTDSGSYYMYFNTRMDANDMDFFRNGLTPYNNVQHDRYNNLNDHQGTSWFRDGNNSGQGDYVNHSRDSQLEGNQSNGGVQGEAYGRISIWVR